MEDSVTIGNDLEQGFKGLDSNQSQIARLAGEGNTDKYIAEKIGKTERDVYRQMIGMFYALDVSGNTYEERRAEVASGAVKFFNLPVAVSTPVPQATKPAIRPTVLPIKKALDASLPTLEVLKNRIRQMSAVEYERFNTGVRAPRGEMSYAAQGLNLAPASFATIMSELYKKLGLPHVDGRRELAQQALDEVGPPSIAKEKKQLSEAVVPAALPGFGGGVTIPLPPDVSSVEVLSGEFTRENPSASLREQILERKRQGAKPAFLVLYPSQQDPNVAQGHVIFIRQETK